MRKERRERKTRPDCQPHLPGWFSVGKVTAVLPPSLAHAPPGRHTLKRPHSLSSLNPHIPAGEAICNLTLSITPPGACGPLLLLQPNTFLPCRLALLGLASHPSSPLHVQKTPTLEPTLRGHVLVTFGFAVRASRPSGGGPWKCSTLALHLWAHI